MNDDHTQFQAIVADSPFLSEKWEGLVDRVQQDGLKYYGVQLTESDVRSLSEIRIATFSNSPIDQDAYQAEFQKLKPFQEQIQLRRIAAGDVHAQATAVQSLDGITDRAAKISAARRLGVASVGKETEGSGMSREDTLKYLVSLPPSQRLVLARRWNLIP